jgi:hypothetical protein
MCMRYRGLKIAFKDKFGFEVIGIGIGSWKEGFSDRDQDQSWKVGLKVPNAGFEVIEIGSWKVGVKVI